MKRTVAAVIDIASGCNALSVLAICNLSFAIRPC
jgi:hypothetical protein